MGLQWTNIDLGRGIIRVACSKVGKDVDIPINDTLCELLESLPRRGDLVFPSPRTGRRLLDVKKGFQAALDRAGIRKFRFHDLRHTFASHLVMAGVSIETVSELLGHSTLRMTQRYTHLSPEHKGRAVKVLDGVYKKDGKDE